MSIRIFVAFDVAHDEDLYQELLDNAGNSSAFEVSAASEACTTQEAWQRRAESRIAAAEQFVVVCGEHTGESLPVAAELRIAQEQDKPVIYLWSRRDAMCKKPAGAAPNDNMYSWSPEVLRDRLAENGRTARRIAVPERLKRKPQTPR